MNTVPDLCSMLKVFNSKYDEEKKDRGEVNQQFRLDLLLEEVEEFHGEIRCNTFDEDAIAEELADIVYVCFGTAVCFDLDLYDALVETHEENMSKEHLKTPEFYE